MSDDSTKRDVIQVRSILESIVSEARDLYHYIKDKPEISAATKKRVLSIHSTILAKTLDKLDELSRAELIINQEAQVVETSDFMSQFMKHRASQKLVSFVKDFASIVVTVTAP